MATKGKGIQIPIDIQINTQSFVREVTAAASQSGKQIEQKMGTAINRAQAIMQRFGEVSKKILATGMLPENMDSKSFKMLQSANTMAESFINAYNRMQEAGNEFASTYTDAYAKLESKAEGYRRTLQTLDVAILQTKQDIEDITRAQAYTNDPKTYDAIIEREDYLNARLPILTRNLEKRAQEIHRINQEWQNGLRETGVNIHEDREYKTWSKQIQNVKTELSELSEQATKARELKSLVQDVSERGLSLGSVPQLSEDLKYQNQLYAETRKNIEAIRVEQEKLEQQGQRYSHIGVSAEVEERVNKAATSMINYASASEEGANKTNKFSNSTKTASKNASNLKKIVSSMTKIFKSTVKHLSELRKHMSKSFDSSQNGLKQALKNVMRYGLGVRSLYFLFRRLRSAAKDAFGVMAQQWEPVNKQISSMIQSLNGVKGSIATMLQPLLEGFANFFNQFMGILQKVMETIGAFFAMLTGQNYILRAKAGGVDWAESLADNLGTAKDEAEELNKQLAGFDKINNLTTKDDKGSGSGKSDIGLNTVAFEKVPIEQLDIFQWLKDMWEKSDFGDLGRTLNSKLKGLLQKIDWEEVEYYGRKVGTCFATAINGFFEDKELASELGKAIAGYFNTIFGTLYEFSTRVEWDQIGVFIVTGIRDFFENANFQNWGEAAGALLSGLLEALYVVVTDESNWELLGQKIIDGINGFMETMLTKKRVFKGFGMNHIPIYEELNGFQIAGGALSGFATNFIETLTSILDDRQLWQNFGQGVGDFISAIDWSQVIIDLSGLVLALLKALATVQNSLIETLEKSDNPIAKGIGMGLDVTLNGDVGKRIAKKFIAGFMQGVEESGLDKDDNRVLSVFAGIISGIKRIFKIQSPSKVMISIAQDVIAGFLNPFNTLSQRFSAIWENVKNGAVSALNNMRNSLASVASSIVGVMNSLSSSVSSMISNILNSFNRLSGIEVNLSGVSSGAILGTKVKIPHLAQGAVIPPNNQFLAMLGDQKSGTNIEAPLSTIEQAVRNVIGEQNINVTFEVQGDPERIFNVVRKQSNQFSKRTGLNLT